MTSVPKPGKKPKTVKQGTWARKMDRWVAYIVILRDRRCVTCGRADDLQPGHYFSRTRNSTRWNLMNTNCQCGGCNILHEGNPEPYRRYLLSKDGETLLGVLERLWASSDMSHITVGVRTEVETYLKGQLEAQLERYTRPREEMLKKIWAGKATNVEITALSQGFRKPKF